MLTPYYEDGTITLYNDDMNDVVRNMENESIDLILTDPPYGIEYVSNHRKSKLKEIKNDDVLYMDVDMFWRVIRETGSLWSFYSHKIELYDKRIKNRIIWVKNNWTAGDLEGDFGNQYECIAFMPKKKFKLNGYRHSNVWNFGRVPPSNHPTEKPVSLLCRIIESCTNEGDLVFDPFAGSGATLFACKMLNRRFVGSEIDEGHCQNIVNDNRLKQMGLGI